jgi:uncharacterized glyoxalase superfamily protein PhnB
LEPKKNFIEELCGKAISHAELQIDDSALMLADELPQIENLSPTTLGRISGGTFLYVEYADKTFDQAVSEMQRCWSLLQMNLG